MTRVWVAVVASVGMHLFVLGALAAHRFSSEEQARSAPQELLFVEVTSGRTSVQREPKHEVATSAVQPERSHEVAESRAQATDLTSPRRGREVANPQPDPSTPADAAAQGERRADSRPDPSTPADASAQGERQPDRSTPADAPAQGERWADPLPQAARPGASAQGPDLAAIHARLAAAAIDCYPASARRFGLSGTVPVRFCVSGSGAIWGVELRGTSGHSSLDRAATDCVIARAAPMPIASSCFDVPVAFR